MPVVFIGAGFAGTDVVYAKNFGCVADCIQLLDGVVVAGSSYVTSATALFTIGDVGKKIVLNAPHTPHTDTVSTTIGNEFYTSANLLSLNTRISPQGLNIVTLSNGLTAAIRLILSDVSLWTMTKATSNASNLIMYLDQQYETTIQEVIDTHTIRIDAVPSVSWSNVKFTYGTDNTLAINNACLFALARNKPVVQIPEGNVGIADNLSFNNISNLQIQGTGRNSTILMDLRAASNIGPSPVNTRYGVFSFTSSSGIKITSLSYDGNVPFMCMYTSSNFARKFIYAQGSSDIQIQDLGSSGFGARDEYCYVNHANAGVQGLTVANCILPYVNTNAINCNMPDSIIIGNRINAGQQGLIVYGYNLIITDNEVSSDVESVGITAGSGTTPFVVNPAGRSLVANNIVRKANLTASGAYGITIFGEGSHDVNGMLHVVDNLVYDISFGSGAPIGIVLDTAGTINIADNKVDNCTATNSNTAMVYIANTNIANITIKSNVFRTKAGSNQTVGVQGQAGHASNLITVDASNTFDPLITEILKGDGFTNTNSLVVDVPNMPSGTSYLSAGVTIANVSMGDIVTVSASYDLNGLMIQGFVSAPNTVKFLLINLTGVDVDPGSATYYFQVSRKINK
jgi:hypothetical protein